MPVTGQPRGFYGGFMGQGRGLGGLGRWMIRWLDGLWARGGGEDQEGQGQGVFRSAGNFAIHMEILQDAWRFRWGYAVSAYLN